MAVAETQLYSKVLNKVKNRSTCALLESLLSMGFPAHTAQKALAATGHKTAEEASKWLHSHCNDPSLDDPIPQEYALYLCPTGPLHDKLQEFWKESKNQCARNKAHEIFPHITLCDFFTCEDRKVEFLHEALKKVGDRFLNVFPPAISLSLHSSVSYLGFFINDAHANVIKEFAVAFATEASILADCHVKPCTKQLHLTLAHKFYPHHQKTLEQLAKSINPGHSCLWTAALYSRDMRFVNYQILQALFQYKPQNIDELMLNTGDLIYVDRSQQSDVSDGWVIGTSHRTGCRGFLPENYTEKANESDTWVKHREYTFTPASGLLPKNENEPRRKLNGEVHNPIMTKNVTQTLAFQLSQTVALRRSLLVMRHGERVDHVFGKSWIQQCLTADGKYHRADLNFPASLPKRRDGIKHFEYDPPLSCCGVFQSRLVGEALLEKQETVSHVYCSPALRCIQTAQHVLEGLKLEQKIKIRVEPGLFEWTKWEANKIIPSFMALTELTEATYNIDPSYRCTFPLSSLVPSESYEEYVSRCSAVIKQIVSDCTSNGIILIVGHGSSLDSFTRPVLRLPARDSNDFASLVRKIPSLGMCFCEELKEENRWQMINPPVKTLTHGSNAAFNWRNGILDS
ncbi:ubiquitin-associated and SH3 domain-containing protein A isoform X1 [Mauremys reevesii]|uniref:ubiquitin-associated and SH3 domain-containing protein A isoform X1 n=1 Tax=Mauremys reevesii TaxID=260615 RepID=UPI00193F6C7E|nr:ubiquitin-associated and SH3 domain-containing protein A isoform X1 [Mauremys reevesii]